MKKILAVLLVVAMVFALSACGNINKIKSVISEIADEVELDDGDMILEDSDEDEGEPSKPGAKGKYTISNELLVDNEYLTITIVEAFENDYGDFILKILVENKSDKNIYITNSGDMTYNGYMVSGWWSTDVAPGKKANTEMSIYSDELELADAGVAEEITFNISAFNPDDYEEEYYIDDYFAVYPTGLDAGSVTYPDRAPAPGETVIVDNEDLKFVIESINEDDSWAYQLQVYVENRTDKIMYINWEDESVNGFMVDSYWGDTVLSGMKAVSSAYFSNDSLDANGITDVEEIEFKLLARGEGWDNIVFEDTFVFNP